MSSGICKNEEEEKKGKKSNTISFMIYVGIIILGLLLLIVIIYFIYSLFSNSNSNSTSTSTSSLITPTFKTEDLNSFKQIPNITSASIPPPLPKISIDNVSTNKKPFLSSLMNTTTEKTDKAINSLVNPLYNRKIPINTGGFRCINTRRF
jgi:cytoskeletal protein RodZ